MYLHVVENLESSQSITETIGGNGGHGHRASSYLSGLLNSVDQVIVVE